MRIDLEANRIRPCSTTVAFLHWQNLGTASADSVSIVLTLPPNTQLTDAQLPATDLGSYLFRFQSVRTDQYGITHHRIDRFGIIIPR